MSETTNQRQLHINGEFVDACSGATFTSINPATEEAICEVACADAADVGLAVAAARAQMEPGSAWQKMKPRDRAKVMWKLADILSSRAAEIGRIETIDNGKPIFESQFVDTPASAACLYYFAGWSGKNTGETIPVSGGAFTYTVREPVGVVAAITPWNFPLMMPTWKIAPALACGNTMVGFEFEPLESKRASAPASTGRELGPHPVDGEPIVVKDGRYGPYVAHGKVNATLPKDIAPEAITLEQAIDLLAAKEDKAPTKAKKASKSTKAK